MPPISTLTDVLNSQLSSDLTIECIQGQDAVTTLTPASLKTKASSVLATLQARGMKEGDELVIHTQSNADFIVAFWAAVLGAMVPVPVAVGISDDHRNKLLRIVSQLNNPRIYTTKDLSQRLHDFAQSSDTATVLREPARWITSDDCDDSKSGRECVNSPDQLAFIQYSSGSTGNPKGVCLTHKNVTTNIRAIVEGATWTADDRALSWMPLTHDMGLIGFHLSVLAAGMNHAIMDTSLFVRRPKLWMELAASKRTTILCSPNFGYQHFLKAVQRKGPDTLDLSHVRQILNGAEPISKELCDTFNATLAPSGLRATAMRPVYGLAEATVGVTFSAADAGCTSTRVNRNSLAIADELDPVNEDHPNGIDLVHLGQAMRDVHMRIVDDSDTELPVSTVGHLQLRGDSVTSQIYGDPETTRTMFTTDGWLRTGDSGAFVLHEGKSNLVIVGRIKDVLISSGQNYYAHDIEACVSDVPGGELGKVAVASVRLPQQPEEQVAVFVVYRKDADDFAALASSLRATISARAGLEADLIIPVPRIPKTTSGKIQRHHLANSLVTGEFDDVLSIKGVVAGAGNPSDSQEPSGEESDAPDVCSELVAVAKEFVTEGAIGADDNLFEAGVSSLTLTEIALAIEERYPGKLDVSDLFDYPTLREIAAWVQRD